MNRWVLGLAALALILSVIIGCEVNAVTETVATNCFVSFSLSQHATEEDYYANAIFCSEFLNQSTCEAIGNEGFCTWFEVD